MSKDGAITIMQGRAVGGTTWSTGPPASAPGRHPAALGRRLWREGPQRRRHGALVREDGAAFGRRARGHAAERQQPGDRRRLREVGYAWKVIPQRAGCWNLGYCGMGCLVNAKQSMLVTTIPATLDKGGELLFPCPCRAPASMTAIGLRHGMPGSWMNARWPPTAGANGQGAATTCWLAAASTRPALLLRPGADPHGRSASAPSCTW